MKYDYDREMWPKFRTEELELIFADEEEGGTGGGILFDSSKDKKQRRKQERKEKQQELKKKQQQLKQSKKNNKHFDEPLLLGDLDSDSLGLTAGVEVSRMAPAGMASSHSHSGVFPSEFEAEQQKENARRKQKKWKTLGRSVSKLWKKIVLEEEEQQQQQQHEQGLGLSQATPAEEQIQMAMAMSLNDKFQRGEQQQMRERQETGQSYYYAGESIIDRIEPQQQQQQPLAMLATQPTYYHARPSAPETCFFYPQASYNQSASVPCPGRTLAY